MPPNLQFSFAASKSLVYPQSFFDASVLDGYHVDGVADPDRLLERLLVDVTPDGVPCGPAYVDLVVELF